MLTLDQKLAIEEREHTSRFSNQQLPVYHVVHHYILQSYTHHLYLILHRDTLHIQDTSNAIMLQSRQRCKSSAMTILETHGHLCETVEFRPYQWYVYGLGSFQAFLAASVLIMLSPINTTMNDDAYRLRDLVEQCVQRLEIMADRSEICARASTILRQVLQNGIQTRSGQPCVENNSSALLPREHLQPYAISPRSHLQHHAADVFACNSNLELEELLFDMTPQQWMAPSAFMWDR